MATKDDKPGLDPIFLRRERDGVEEFWPSIIGDSNELFLKCMNMNKKEKAHLTYAIFTRLSRPMENERIVWILDRDLEFSHRFQFITMNDIPDRTIEFYTNVEKLKNIPEYKNNSLWKNAVMEALEVIIGGPDADVGDSCDDFSHGKYTICSDREANRINRPGSTNLGSETSTKRKIALGATETEPKRSCLTPQGKPAPDSQRSECALPQSVIKNTMNTASPNSALPTDDMGDFEARANVSPQDKDKSDFSTIDKCRVKNMKGKRMEKNIRNKTWEEVWQFLQDHHHWSTSKGKGMVDQYYIHGEHYLQDLDWVKTKKVGVDYFTSEDQVKKYVSEKFGWKGPEGQEYQRHKKGGHQNKNGGKVDSNPGQLNLGTASSPKRDMPPTKMPVAKSPPKKVAAVSSPKQAESQKTPSHPELGHLITIDQAWPDVLSILEYQLKLKHKCIEGINSFVLDKHESMKSADIVKTLKRHEDHFIGEEDLKVYAHGKYGWVGPVGKEYSPISGKRNSRSRTNQNLQSTPGRKNAKAKSAAKPVIEAATKSPPKKASGKRRRNVRKESSISSKPKRLTHQNSKEKQVAAVSVQPSRKKKRKIQNQATLKEKLIDCTHRLGDTFASDNMMFDGSKSSSNFSTGRDQVLSFIENCASNLHDGTRPRYSSFLYVCGRPGTGKTTMVKHCTNLAKKTQRAQFKMVSSFVNSTDIRSTPEKLLEHISKMIGKNALKNDRQKLESALTTGKSKGPVVLIIDEIDFLCCSQASNKKEESVLDTIFRWTSDVENRLVVIGITNSVGDDIARSLHDKVEIQEEVIFHPFTDSDLCEIIKLRLGEHTLVVDDNAIRFLSRKIAKSKGDAREVIGIMHAAISNAIETVSPDILSKTVLDDPIIKMPHIMKAIRGAGNNSMVDTIKSLPQNAKVVLCIATSLGLVSSSWKTICMSNLKLFCGEATGHGLIESWSQEQFKEVVEQLADAGLIIYEESDEVIDYSGDQCVRVGAQLEDVELAMDHTLLHEAFYRNLVEYVKKKDAQQKDLFK